MKRDEMQLDVPALTPGAVPMSVAGPASRSLAFVEQVDSVDLDGFEEHELERLLTVVGDARQRAEDVRRKVEAAKWAKAHPGEAF